jgi:multiple sugar transport system permease protein
VSASVARRRGRVIDRMAFACLLVALVTPILGFFYFMVATSLKSPLDVSAPEFKWLFEPTLENYRSAFASNDFGAYTLNSSIVAVGSTLIGLLIGVPAAYVIAREQKLRWAGLVLASRVTPGIAFIIPLFILFRMVGWVDTYQALIASHLIVNLPLVIWLMVGYFEGLPADLLDAAVVDGASEIKVFRSIAIPLVRNGIAASAILAFVYSWNNFLFSVVLSGSDTATLPVAVFNFMSYGSLDWGGIAAGAVIMTLPILVLVLLMQRQLLEGLTAGWER